MIKIVIGSSREWPFHSLAWLIVLLKSLSWKSKRLLSKSHYMSTLL